MGFSAQDYLLAAIPMALSEDFNDMLVDVLEWGEVTGELHSYKNANVGTGLTMAEVSQSWTQERLREEIHWTWRGALVAGGVTMFLTFLEREEDISHNFGLGFLVGAGRPSVDGDRQHLVAYYCGQDFPPPYEAPPSYRSVVPRPKLAQRMIQRVRKTVACVLRPRVVFTIRGN